MAKRVTKSIALELIQYCKKIDCVANIRRPGSKSAIEFAKQMMSTKLKKKNPTIQVNMLFHEDDQAPYVYCEFTDGQSLKIETGEIHLPDIRAQFFARAELAEEAAEEAEGDFSMDEAGGAKGKTAAKPAAKPAGKK